MVTQMTEDRNNSLFNEEVKNQYLHEMILIGSISEETSKSYNRIFTVTNEIEEALGKDLSEFTLQEIETILYGFKANNRNTVESYARIISSYLNWCVQQGISKRNPLYVLNPTDFEKYLTNEEEYFTDAQLRRYEDQCQNYQDAVIIRLLFNGVGGKQLTEIRNLKKDEVDFIQKRMKLINTLSSDDNGNPLQFTERWIDIDERTISLLVGAMGQKIYTKRNGDMIPRENIRPYTDLVDNQYIVRASITKTEKFNSPVDKFVIYRRVQTIAESLGIEEFTAKFIQRSGMIHYANQLIRDEKLTLNDIKMVADRFNLKSYHNLKGFLTVENIRKTYPKNGEE